MAWAWRTALSPDFLDLHSLHAATRNSKRCVFSVPRRGELKLILYGRKTLEWSFFTESYAFSNFCLPSHLRIYRQLRKVEHKEVAKLPAGY